MSEKHCVICGNKDGYTPPPQSNLTERDCQVGHCRNCGKPVCGFCEHLGVCCDLDAELED
jgi:hypothetical protein